MDELHAERQRHAQDLLRLAFRLDDDGRDHRLAGFDAAVLAGEADLLGAGVLALKAEFGPGRIDQLNLVGGLGARGGSSCRRGGGRLLCRRSRGFRCSLRRGLGLGRSGRRTGRRLLGLSAGSQQTGGQCSRRQQGDKSPTRPCRRGQDTEIHCGKPFLNGSGSNRCRHRHLAVGRLFLCQIRRIRDRPCRLGQIARLQYSGGRKDQCRQAPLPPAGTGCGKGGKMLS